MSKIEFSSDANAYRITLNDPPLHILDIAMLEELRDALGKVNNDRHCLIITASGEKSFSAGAFAAKAANIGSLLPPSPIL